MYPDTADSYLRLIEAIDRKGFAAHLDPVNVICSPQLYYRNGEVIREWFDKLARRSAAATRRTSSSAAG